MSGIARQAGRLPHKNVPECLWGGRLADVLTFNVQRLTFNASMIDSTL
jgi:hypothetical protein